MFGECFYNVAHYLHQNYHFVMTIGVENLKYYVFKFQFCLLRSGVHRGQVEPEHPSRPEAGDGSTAARRFVKKYCQN